MSVCEASLPHLQLSEDATVTLIVRGSELVAARGQTVLMPGDLVYVFFRPADRRYGNVLPGRPESS